MLEQESKQFGIELAQAPPWFGAARLIEQALIYPELEEEFDLPACPQPQECLLAAQERRWDIGDANGPVGAGQASGAHRPSAALGLLLQPPPAGCSDLRSHADGQQAGKKPLADAQGHRQVEPGLGLGL